MRVKLGRRLTRKLGKEYVTYFITLPKDIVVAMSLTDVDEVELELRVVDGKNAIVITKPEG